MEEGSSRPTAPGSEMLETIKAGKEIGAETLVDHNTCLSLSSWRYAEVHKNANSGFIQQLRYWFVTVDDVTTLYT